MKNSCQVRSATGRSPSMQGGTFGRSAGLWRALAALYISSTFLWTLVLSVSPQLHERIHSDASQSGHECAITLVTAGNYHHAVAGQLVTAPASAIPCSKIPALISHWVESPFLGASIFEHAPPAYS